MTVPWRIPRFTRILRRPDRHDAHPGRCCYSSPTSSTVCELQNMWVLVRPRSVPAGNMVIFVQPPISPRRLTALLRYSRRLDSGGTVRTVLPIRLFKSLLDVAVCPRAQITSISGRANELVSVQLHQHHVEAGAGAASGAGAGAVAVGVGASPSTGFAFLPLPGGGGW